MDEETEATARLVTGQAGADGGYSKLRLWAPAGRPFQNLRCRRVKVGWPGGVSGTQEFQMPRKAQTTS